MPEIKKMLLLGIILSIAASLINNPAKAGILYTFSFIQDGYLAQTNDFPQDTILSGTFTGSVNSLGYITETELTHFHASITTNGFNYIKPWDSVESFSFHPGLPVDSASLNFKTPGFVTLCVGASAAFGLCTNHRNGIFGAVGPEILETLHPPIVTFDNVAAVPEPSTWAMMLLGFAGVGFMACRRKPTPINIDGCLMTSIVQRPRHY